MIGLAIAGLFLVYSIININNPKKIIFSQFVFISFGLLLISSFGASRGILYLCDLNNVLLLLNMFHRKRFVSKELRFVVVAASVFFLWGTISAIINMSSLLLLIWSYRIYGRFIVFFIACAVYLHSDDVDKIIKFFLGVMPLNLILSIYQFWVLGYSRDNLGGIFGTDVGCNAYTNFLLIIAVSFSITMFIEKKISIYWVLMTLGCSLICASLSELKFFYLELVLIMGLIFLMSKPSKTQFVFILVSIVAVVLGVSYYGKHNGAFDFFSVDDLERYLYRLGYASSAEAITRTNGFSVINNLFLDSDYKRMIGLGLGAAEHSSYFTSDIYISYAYIQYDWFLYAMLYLETGFIGLVTYVMFWLSIIYIIIRRKKTQNFLGKTILIISILEIISIWYNSGLRYDSGYIVFGIIALGFISDFDNIDMLNKLKFNNKVKLIWGKK